MCKIIMSLKEKFVRRHVLNVNKCLSSDRNSLTFNCPLVNPFHKAQDFYPATRKSKVYLSIRIDHIFVRNNPEFGITNVKWVDIGHCCKI